MFANLLNQRLLASKVLDGNHLLLTLEINTPFPFRINFYSRGTTFSEVPNKRGALITMYVGTFFKY